MSSWIICHAFVVGMEMPSPGPIAGPAAVGGAAGGGNLPDSSGMGREAPTAVGNVDGPMAVFWLPD